MSTGVVMAGAAPASAGRVAGAGFEASFTANPGERNHLTVTEEAAITRPGPPGEPDIIEVPFVVRDAVPITLGADCSYIAGNPRVARCRPSSGDQTLALGIDLGDRSDTAVVRMRGRIQITVEAAGGYDSVTSVNLGGQDFFQADLGIGNDVFRGGSGPDQVYGGSWNDTLYGGGGGDQLTGGPGADRLYGGTGNDVLRGGFGFDRMFGGPGTDVIDGMRRDVRFG